MPRDAIALRAGDELRSDEGGVRGPVTSDAEAAGKNRDTVGVKMSAVVTDQYVPVAPWPVRLFGAGFHVVVHLLFAFLLLVAMMDARQGHSSGDWQGMGAFAAAMVLGFPWSLLGLFAWAPILFVAPVVNYALLWRFTFMRTRRQSPGATWGAAFVAIAIPTVLFAAFHFLLAWSKLGTVRQYPQHTFFDMGAFLVPAMAIANLWVLGRGFSSRAKLVAAGLVLPVLGALAELVWQATWYRFREPLVDQVVLAVIACFMLPTLWSRTWPVRAAVVHDVDRPPG